MAEALTAEQKALVEGCIGLAYQVARNWYKRVSGAGLRVDPDEFVAVCYEAMCRAARTFRPELGFRFTTHATAAMHFQCVEHSDFLRGYRKGWRNRNTELRKRGRETEAPQGMSFGLARLAYTWAAPGDDGEREEARERAGLVLERMDEKVRGAVMLRARGALLRTVAEDLGGVSRERARQVCTEAGRSAVMRSVAGR